MGPFSKEVYNHYLFEYSFIISITEPLICDWNQEPQINSSNLHLQKNEFQVHKSTFCLLREYTVKIANRNIKNFTHPDYLIPSNNLDERGMLGLHFS